MKTIKFLICTFFVIAFASCLSIPPKNNASDVKVYFYQNTSVEYTEIESIGLSEKLNFVTYSLDRENALIMLEMGSYSIFDDVITINAGRFQATGTITEEKIIIDDKEFIRHIKT